MYLSYIEYGLILDNRMYTTLCYIPISRYISTTFWNLGRWRIMIVKLIS